MEIANPTEIAGNELALEIGLDIHVYCQQFQLRFLHGVVRLRLWHFVTRIGVISHQSDPNALSRPYSHAGLIIRWPRYW